MPESRRRPEVHSPSWLLGKTPPRRYEDWQLGTSARETMVVLRTQVPWVPPCSAASFPPPQARPAAKPGHLSLGRCTHPQLWEKNQNNLQGWGRGGGALG